ncbi:antirestriction protein ArdA [Ruminococcaceae bacterium OttesenSCG-928-A16]|nr:antirestriction protein ArdA [Ruminococcaceae bacterium OttesenSCG-928-A16]
MSGEMNVEAGPEKQPLISAYVTNLGKYNEGELVGEWLPLPTTTEKVQEMLGRIGIDGIRYEEYFVTDYDVYVDGLYDHLPEYANLDELNYLAVCLEELDKWDFEKYEAVLESGMQVSSVGDAINLTDNMDCFEYLQGVHDEGDLGYYWIEDSGCYDLKGMGNLASYFDYEKFGRDIALDEGGTFTNSGYVTGGRDNFTEFYSGIEDIPEEHKVFAYPERPVKGKPTKGEPDHER